MFTLTGNPDINNSLQERFAGANFKDSEMSLQGARSVKEENLEPLKLDDRHKMLEGLTNVKAERQNSSFHQISYGNERLTYSQLLVYKD